jgi:hypothetical protein
MLCQVVSVCFLLSPPPATASAEGAQLNGRPFPATASAEGRQFNGAPSPWERVRVRGFMEMREAAKPLTPRPLPVGEGAKAIVNRTEIFMLTMH